MPFSDFFSEALLLIKVDLKLTWILLMLQAKTQMNARTRLIRETRLNAHVKIVYKK